jgi:putative transcriptional regulator
MMSFADSSYLASHLLIAMPTMADANFARGVTLLCQHNAEGAMGLIINRPSDYRLGDVMAHVGIDSVPEDLAKRVVLSGGPVEPERGFVLHEPCARFESSASISEQLQVTTSRDVLLSIAEGRGPERFVVMLGYAGWGAGQLEKELRENAWLTARASDNRIVFDTPLEQRWDASARLLGIDIHLMGSVAGHA